MALFDAVMRGSVGLAKGIGLGAYSFARHAPGAFLATSGAVAGAALSVAQGDNHDSTSFMRNIISGAGVGAVAGLGLRGLFSRTAMRGAGHFLGINQTRAAKSGMHMAAFRGSPLTRLSGAGGRSAYGAAKTGLGILGFAAKHPALTLGTAIITGGAYSQLGDFTTEQDTSDRFSLENKDVEQYGNNSFASSSFANSASGLSFGLHSRRHG